MWWMPLSFMSISRLLRDAFAMIARATISCERLARGLLAKFLDGPSLLLGAVAQAFEQGDVEPRLARSYLEPRAPAPPLAGDARQEPLELDDAAQRRVARELAVQLQPAHLLQPPGRYVLDAVAPEAQIAQA